jgi:hypothetical protein
VTEDLVISFSVIAVVVVAHVGMIITCWCRTDNVIPPVWKRPVGLIPVSAEEEIARWVEIILGAAAGFVLICVLIFLAGYYDSWSRTVLCIGEEEACKIQFRLQELRDTHEALEKVRE